MIDRILEIMQNKNLSPSQFADEIGIQRSGISHLISGRNKPSLEFIMKVLKRFPDIKPEWLLYGELTEERVEIKPEGTPVEKQKSLFDEPEISDPADQKKIIRSLKKERIEKRIEKIVVFYQDRTFREYEPD